MIELYCDGSCMGNHTKTDRQAGAGYVAVRDGERVSEGHEAAGDGPDVSNNTAEYDAILAALRWRRDNVPDETAHIYTDSKLVTNQISGDWSCNAEHLEERRDAVRAIRKPTDRIKYKQEDPHLVRAHDLAQAGANRTSPPDTSPKTRTRSTSGGGGVTEINVEPLPETPRLLEPVDDIETSNLPEDMLRRPQWVNWVMSVRNDEETKIPWQGWNEDTAKSNDPGTWADVETALDSVGEPVPSWISDVCDVVPGVGFVLTTGDPYCAIDLDNCRDAETGEVNQWAKYVVNSIDSYCQVSVSGTGLHVFVRGGSIPESWKNKKEDKWEMEIYEWGRFMTMTGQIYDEYDEISYRPDFEDWVKEIDDTLYA